MWIELGPPKRYFHVLIIKPIQKGSRAPGSSEFMLTGRIQSRDLARVEIPTTGGGQTR